jgi:hypothetical protein
MFKDRLAEIEEANKSLQKRIDDQLQRRKPLGLVKESERKRTPVDGRGLNGPHKAELEQKIKKENEVSLIPLKSRVKSLK